MTMRRIDLQPLEPFTSDFIDRTGAFNPGALEAATVIIEQVRQEGDGAPARAHREVDGVAIENFPRARARPSMPRWRRWIRTPSRP